MGHEEESTQSGTTNSGLCAAIGARIRQHWTVPPKHRTPEQDEAEAWLITLYLGKNRYWTPRWLRFSRWYLFVATFISQYIIGALYAWSVFNKPIDKHIYDDATAAKAVNAFYTAVGVFGLTSSTMGPWVERNGPRMGVIIGATSYLTGYIIAAIGLYVKSMGLIIFGYGIFCGAGIALCYISPVSALQKWFPDYRGTAAGFAVGGYGMGSVVFSKMYIPLMDAFGLAGTFVFLGIMSSAVLYLCSIVLRTPPLDYVVSGLNIHGERVDQKELHDTAHFDELRKQGDVSVSVRSSHGEYMVILTPNTKATQESKLLSEENTQQQISAMSEVRKLTLIDAILSLDFMFMYIMFFANQLYGLILLSKLSSMCTDIFGKSADAAADIVSINGAFNCIGRVLFPAVSDLFLRLTKIGPARGRKWIYVYTLISQLFVVGTIPTLIRNDHYILFVLEVFFLTASYGGGFGSIPCFLTDMFGAFNTGAMHGLILTAWSIGGVAGGIGFNNAYIDAIASGTTVPEAYVQMIHKIFVIMLIGFVFVFLIRTDPRDRFAPEGGYRFSICGKNIFHIKPKHKNHQPSPLLGDGTAV